MGTIEIYNEKEADALIKHYSPLLIDRKLSQESTNLVSKLIKQDLDGTQFLVVVMGEEKRPNFMVPSRNLAGMCKEFGLDSPDTTLKNLGYR